MALHKHGSRNSPEILEVLPPVCEEARLAEVLFGKMEHLDPSEEGERGWRGLTDHEREFYLSCVEAVVRAQSSPTTTK